MKNIKKFFSILIVILACIFFTKPGLAFDWQTEFIEIMHDFSPSSLGFELDQQDHMHVAYGGYDGLYYAYWDGSTWQIQKVNSNKALYATLVLDNQEAPNIAYADFAGNLHYTYWDGTGWQDQVVDDNTRVNGISMALDAIGGVHVAYRDYENKIIKYAFFDGTEWQVQSVDGSSGAYGIPSLAMDSSGYPHIAFQGYDGSSDFVKYTYWDGSRWNTVTISSPAARDPHLALDDQDRPYIGYRIEDWYTGDYLRLAYMSDDGTWINQTLLDSDGNKVYGYLPYIRLDTNDNPSIAFFVDGLQAGTDENSDVLEYASLTPNGNWAIQRIAVVARVNYQYQDCTPVLRFASNGIPQVVYFGNNELKYAKQQANQWNIQTVDRSGTAGHYAALVLDDLGNPHVLYDLESGDIHKLIYGYLDEDGWHTQPVESSDSVNYPGTSVSLAIDPSGNPHIAYTSSKMLKYGYMDGSQWHIESIESCGTYDCWPSLVVDSLGKPHISYLKTYWKNWWGWVTDLRYTYWDGSQWQSETASGLINASTRTRTSLALDLEGLPHIAFQGESYKRKMRYVYQLKSGRWLNSGSYSVVDSSGDTGYYPSLKIDFLDMPHVAYLKGDDPGDLMYATIDYENFEWKTEPVAQGVEEAELSLDDLGQPHLAIDTADGVGVASRSGGQWTIDPVDEGSMRVKGFAIDSSKGMHVLYQVDGSSLKYAFKPVAPQLTWNTLLFSEDFSTGIPDDWQIVHQGNGSTWGTEDVHSCMWDDPAPGLFTKPWAIIDGCDDSYHDEALITPVIDISNFAGESIHLQFSNNFSKWVYSRAQVDISTDHGATWTHVLDINESVEAKELLDLTSVLSGKDHLLVRFHYIASSGEEYWVIDNVDLAVTKPNQISFDRTQYGESTFRTLRIGNSGLGFLNIQSIEIVGDAYDDFAVQYDNCPGSPPFSLNPGEACTISIEFSPNADGERNAYLHILSDDPENSEQLIQLVGIGELENAPPVIDSFTAEPISGDAPLTVNFTCQAHDPDGGIIESIEWFFDPGDWPDDLTINNNFTITHTYDTPGVYVAHCRVWDDENQNATSGNITITVNAPTVNYRLDVSVNPEDGGTVTGNGINCPDDCNETYEEGTSVTLTASPSDGYRFSSWSGDCVGCEDATCTIAMDLDKTCTANFEPIPNEPPVIDSFTVEPTSGDAPLTVTFTCEAHDNDGSVVEYCFDFDGDGENNQCDDSTNIATFTYNEPGTYHPTCTVIDDDEESVTSDPQEITVNEVAPSWVDITETLNITHSARQLYDRIHRCFFIQVTVENPGDAISGPIRLVITDPSIPVKTGVGVGLEPDGYTDDGDPYFIIVPEEGSLNAGEVLRNLRINFELQRRRLTYGIRVEQLTAE